MTKRVLEVGNCGADHFALSRLLDSNFDVQIELAHSHVEAIEAMSGSTFDLVLVNRIFDRDGGQGMDLIREVCENEELSPTPIMLITNYDDFQNAATALGAKPGFGKSELNSDQTLAKLQEYLA